MFHICQHNEGSICSYEEDKLDWVLLFTWWKILGVWPVMKVETVIKTNEKYLFPKLAYTKDCLVGCDMGQSTLLLSFDWPFCFFIVYNVSAS